MVGRKRVRLVTTAFLAVVVAAGVGVNHLDQHYQPAAPHRIEIELGEDAEVAPFQVHVHGARAVRTVTDIHGETVSTTGVWVVVDLSYATLTESKVPQQVMLRDSHGRVYQHSQRASRGLWMGYPDLWFRGAVAIEVPEDALGQVTVEFWPDSIYVQAPLRYGSVDVFLNPDELSSEPFIMDRSELLPGGER